MYYTQSPNSDDYFIEPYFEYYSPSADLKPLCLFTKKNRYHPYHQAPYSGSDLRSKLNKSSNQKKSTSKPSNDITSIIPEDDVKFALQRLNNNKKNSTQKQSNDITLVSPIDKIINFNNSNNEIAIYIERIHSLSKSLTLLSKELDDLEKDLLEFKDLDSAHQALSQILYNSTNIPLTEYNPSSITDYIAKKKNEAKKRVHLKEQIKFLEQQVIASRKEQIETTEQKMVSDPKEQIESPEQQMLSDPREQLEFIEQQMLSIKEKSYDLITIQPITLLTNILINLYNINRVMFELRYFIGILKGCSRHISFSIENNYNYKLNDTMNYNHQNFNLSLIKMTDKLRIVNKIYMDYFVNIEIDDNIEITLLTAKDLIIKLNEIINCISGLEEIHIESQSYLVEIYKKLSPFNDKLQSKASQKNNSSDISESDKKLKLIALNFDTCIQYININTPPSIEYIKKPLTKIKLRTPYKINILDSSLVNDITPNSEEKNDELRLNSLNPKKVPTIENLQTTEKKHLTKKTPIYYTEKNNTLCIESLNITKSSIVNNYQSTTRKHFTTTPHTLFILTNMNLILETSKLNIDCLNNYIQYYQSSNICYYQNLSHFILTIRTINKDINIFTKGLSLVLQSISYLNKDINACCTLLWRRGNTDVNEKTNCLYSCINIEKINSFILQVNTAILDVLSINNDAILSAGISIENDYISQSQRHLNIDKITENIIQPITNCILYLSTLTETLHAYYSNEYRKCIQDFHEILQSVQDYIPNIKYPELAKEVINNNISYCLDSAASVVKTIPPSKERNTLLTKAENTYIEITKGMYPIYFHDKESDEIPLPMSL